MQQFEPTRIPYWQLPASLHLMMLSNEKTPHKQYGVNMALALFIIIRENIFMNWAKNKKSMKPPPLEVGLHVDNFSDCNKLLFTWRYEDLLWSNWDFSWGHVFHINEPGPQHSCGSWLLNATTSWVMYRTFHVVIKRSELSLEGSIKLLWTFRNEIKQQQKKMSVVWRQISTKSTQHC